MLFVKALAVLAALVAALVETVTVVSFSISVVFCVVTTTASHLSDTATVSGAVAPDALVYISLAFSFASAIDFAGTVILAKRVSTVVDADERKGRLAMMAMFVVVVEKCCSCCCSKKVTVVDGRANSKIKYT